MHDSARAGSLSGGDLITLTVRSSRWCHCSQRPASSDVAGLRRLISLIGCTINLKVKHWGSLNSTPLQYSMVLSWIPDSGKSGMGMGMDPRSPANRGWGWGWTPDPRRQIGDGDGDWDRGFRALALPGPSPLRGRGIGPRARPPLASCDDSDSELRRAATCHSRALLAWPDSADSPLKGQWASGRESRSRRTPPTARGQQLGWQRASVSNKLQMSLRVTLT